MSNPIIAAGEAKLKDERDMNRRRYDMRTERFLKLADHRAPEFILRQEQKLINEAIEAIIEEVANEYDARNGRPHS